MREVLTTTPRLPREAETTEGRLADIFEAAHSVIIDNRAVAKSDVDKIIAALRQAAMNK